VVVRGLSRDEIFELLATIRPESAKERELKRRAQEYLAARDAARREDAAQDPTIAALTRTYETAEAIAELRRGALAVALPALDAKSELAREVEDLLAAASHDDLASSHSSADEQIQELKAAREDVLAYARRCGAVGDRVIAVLGDAHIASRELLEAKELL
jgi:hypothetical protein